MKKILPNGLEVRDSYRLLSSVIAPRPIAFVSTVNKNGVPNAAPFCFFMGLTPSPPMIAFSCIRRGDSKKDTIRNIESGRDFVINIVDENLTQAMNMASGSYPPDMSEFDVTGLTPVPSEIVTSPRIAESPVHLECKLRTIVELGDVPTSLVIGEIVCYHVRESLLVDGIVDVKKLHAVGRLGESVYARMTDLFDMIRPA
ncbi:MAG: flavin reductase family protein [Deltaproteobacteria bacterium]|nr:flavin reductase family protein [Deltaproteobacteria bacterium]